MKSSSKRIILASASPRRKQLLQQIGLEFDIIAAQGEEKTAEKDPGKVVEALSYGKAEEVFRQEAEEPGNVSDGEKRQLIVIGADTIVYCEGEILGKPADREHAERMIRKLQGNTHQVYTGVTVLWEKSGQKHRCTFYECTDVSCFNMCEEEILEYISTEEPYDKAGGYGIQGGFSRYVRGIRGDYNAVVGLPVGRLYQELHAHDLV